MSTLFCWVYSKNHRQWIFTIPTSERLLLTRLGQFGATGTSSSFNDLTSTGHGLSYKSHFVLWLQKCESDVLALSQIIPFLRFEILKIESLKIIFSTCINQKRKYGKENAQRTWTWRQTKRWDHKFTRIFADNFNLTFYRYLNRIACHKVIIKYVDFDGFSNLTWSIVNACIRKPNSEPFDII